MHHIVDTCLCVPEYVPEIREIVKNWTIKACNFYEHATCVSYVRSYFDPSVAGCLPACTTSDYKRFSVLVKKFFFWDGPFIIL